MITSARKLDHLISNKWFSCSISLRIIQPYKYPLDRPPCRNPWRSRSSLCLIDRIFLRRGIMSSRIRRRDLTSRRSSTRGSRRLRRPKGKPVLFQGELLTQWSPALRTLLEYLCNNQLLRNSRQHSSDTENESSELRTGTPVAQSTNALPLLTTHYLDPLFNVPHPKERSFYKAMDICQ